MLKRVVDLTSCDTEPIHIIGAVQPHGALAAADASSLRVDYASLNLEAFTGVSAHDLLGQPLERLLGAANVADLLARDIAPLGPELIRPWLLELPGTAGLRRVECFPHGHDGRIVLEFVPFEDGPSRVWEQDLIRQRIISELVKPDTLEELAQVSADIIREVTGFDRVMIYRFAHDLHGEVIAESTVRPDSFLGLHYPASDIPDPARRHFLLNVIRSIPDINATPSPIVTRSGAVADALHDHPLDLTFSKLRAVAPVHIEYLNNMGVGGSMSISLTSNDHLWGLVACHHYGPLHLPWSRFRFCELLGGTMSALLQSIENATQLKQSIRAEKAAHAMERSAAAGRAVQDVVAEHADELMLQVDAAGMELVLDGHRYRFGRVPRVEGGFAPLQDMASDGIATVEELRPLLRLADPDESRTAGAAYLQLSDDGQDQLVFFRQEYEQTIRWAGKPDKVERQGADGAVRLSPRGSFALWSEERRGRSQPFSDNDREALRIMRRALFALNSLDRERAAVAAQKLAEREEAQLRLTVMEATRRSSLGELASALAHELNQPLAAVTNYVNACRQELRNHGVAIPPDVNALIESAVTESSRAAELVRRLRNFISDGEIVPERIDLAMVIRQGMDLALGEAPDVAPQVVLDIEPALPRIWADPVQLGQLVLNLVRNTLPAMKGRTRRILTIRARTAGEMVEVEVSDTGSGIPEDMRSVIFEPFHRSTTSGMGLGLSLCRSIVEAHGGRIRLQPQDEGACFLFSLPIEGPTP